MNIKNVIVIPLFLLYALNSCVSKKQANDTIYSLVDTKSTKETIYLYKKLSVLVNKGILFGHQDDLAYGVNWKYEEGRSDIKDITGDYPAVYGWDMTGVEKNAANNIDGVPFDKMKQYIKEGYSRGGVITMSWHMDNPLTDKNAWDVTPKSLVSVLPGGKNHEKYKDYLDKGAIFLNSLRDESNKLIPVLFRPFHELNGTWFWWCKNNASPEEFKTLWKFTVNYLKEKGIHNLIYVYNTSDFNSKEEYLEYYPGPEYVDILSFDKYEYGDPTKNNSFIESCQKQLKILNEIAIEQNKIIAIAETGYEQIPYANWWTNTLLKAMGNYKVSYVLIWRNHGWNKDMNPPHMHYYAPYKGQISEKDFVEFYKNNKILFEKEAAKANLYKKNNSKKHKN